ncbi:MAG TPA: hypothetical protein DCZ93_03250 [Elusimicrobia bacterium]|nr:MAG: hypothetical protein A2X35_10065 [Elusimicrobia bacterium GWA2_61_42]OGR76657.1 MAG: hypothetical protein A2X38_03715 [Elusimicrobia bacterium GWC2_61_25]HBB66319.1 hypothetical protein [Elusimicrobiota bacterium]
MKNSDKILAAFLVSMGLFSSLQAGTYVGSLSSGDKDSLMSVAMSAGDNVAGTEGVRDPAETGSNNR